MHFIPPCNVITGIIRTPLLIHEDLEGPLVETLSRHLPQFAHDYIFGSSSPPSQEAAQLASSSRDVPRLGVYIVSSNSDQIGYLSRLWSCVPSRVFQMKGDDFFTKDQGRYDRMGVDRLAVLRGAAEIHGFPALVFDGGTATTYTAADATGKVLGGGIGPGLRLKFKALGDRTDALPNIAPEEVLRRVAEAVEKRKPLPTFARDTKEAIMVDVLGELALKGRDVIERWLEVVGPSEVEEAKKDDSGDSDALKKNFDRAVLVTGGDGDILAQLLQPNRGGIVEVSAGDLSSSDTKTAGKGKAKTATPKFQIMHSKHLIHYGISSAIMNQVRKRRKASEAKAKVQKEDENQKFMGQRVAKIFAVEDDDGDNVFRGSIVGFHKTNGFLVKYDDGDKEHVLAEELQGMLKLYRDNGEKEKKTRKTPAKVKQQPEKTPPSRKRAEPTPSPSAGKAKSPAPAAKKAKKAIVIKGKEATEYITDRVAKDFDGEIYFGTIKSYKGGFWHVRYDDGDEEDYDEKDLKRALRLYSKVENDDPTTKKKRGRQPKAASPPASTKATKAGKSETVATPAANKKETPGSSSSKKRDAAQTAAEATPTTPENSKEKPTGMKENKKPTEDKPEKQPDTKESNAVEIAKKTNKENGDKKAP
mmetsp:Transcript_20809/g.30496  ORF Transcript_20809/g.30496 Transcript_20809/m.30496 type:complete len:644 (+) Transcript_20809:352-2283(+)